MKKSRPFERNYHNLISLFLLTVIYLCSCKSDDPKNEQVYETKNIIIVSIDGPRYSETWGDPTKRNIPYLSTSLRTRGVINTNFYTPGNTFTVPGHASITTGVNESLDNQGNEIPSYPSIFQYWLKGSKDSSTKAWLITSKAKLEVLANCKQADWKDMYMPQVDAADREDSLTFIQFKSIVRKHHPRLILLHFRGPDHYAHAADSSGYINSIRECDKLLQDCWDLIQSDTFYRDRTTLFMTNDHGRHLDNIKDGFIGHGDLCDGCTHLNFYATGPDLRSDTIINLKRYDTSIPSTVARLLGFEMQYGTAPAMMEIMK